MFSCIVAPASQIKRMGGNRWLLKGEEKKNGRQVEEGGKGGTTAGKGKVKHISVLALPTCHSTLLAGCQHVSLQSQLQVTKSSHCPTQGVPSMCNIINCTKTPAVYKEGNYILERVTNSTLLPISNKSALRPAGSLQNDKTTQQTIKKNVITRLSIFLSDLFKFYDLSDLLLT